MIRNLMAAVTMGLAALTMSACGGGGSVTAPAPPPPSPPPPPPPPPSPGSSAPTVRQFAYVDTQDNLGTQVLRLRLPQPTLAGSALFAWSRSAIDGQTENFARFTDDRGNTYVPTGDTESDPDGRVNAAQGTAYAANIAAGTSEITATWAPFGDYRSVIVAEITGVSAQGFLASASNIQRSSSAGTDNLTSGPFNVAVQPALIVAVSSNESQLSGPPFAPLAGTGFTTVGTATNYGGSNDFTRLVMRPITTTGIQAAMFSAPGADEYLTFAIVFR